MERKSIAVLLLIAIVIAAAGFQFFDPRLTSSNAPKEVDFSDPPSEIVFATVTNLNRTDYTYTVVASPNRSETGEEADLVKHLKVENSDQEYVAYGPLGKNGTKVYGNDAVAWVRPPDGDWQLNLQKQYAYPAENELNPFDISAIEDSQGEIVNETSTQVVVRINSSTLEETDVEGYTFFYLDKRTKQIRRMVEVLDPDGDTSYVIVQFNNVGKTTVERPSEVDFSLMELITDLVRYNPNL